MTKAEIFKKMEELLELSSKETLLTLMFNYFSSDDLEGFLEFIKEEFEYE
jgi:hypothetical protein